MHWKSAWVFLMMTVAVMGVAVLRGGRGVGDTPPLPSAEKRFAVRVAMEFGAQCYAISSLPGNSLGWNPVSILEAEDDEKISQGGVRGK